MEKKWSKGFNIFENDIQGIQFKEGTNLGGHIGALETVKYGLSKQGTKLTILFVPESQCYLLDVQVKLKDKKQKSYLIFKSKLNSQRQTDGSWIIQYDIIINKFNQVIQCLGKLHCVQAKKTRNQFFGWNMKFSKVNYLILYFLIEY